MWDYKNISANKHQHFPLDFFQVILFQEVNKSQLLTISKLLKITIYLPHLLRILGNALDMVDNLDFITHLDICHSLGYSRAKDK
jgi:hypothetical protein